MTGGNYDLLRGGVFDSLAVSSPPPPPPPLSTGLAAWYRNNEVDWSGHGRTLIPLGGGATGTGPGIDGTPDAAMKLNGVPNGFLGPSNPPIPGGTTSWSIQAWLNRGVSDTAPLFELGDTNGTPSVAPVLVASGTVTLAGKGTSVASSPPTYTGASVGAQPTGEWHHLVATYDGTAARLYVDGALVATQTIAITVLTPYTSLRGSGPGTVTTPDYVQFVGFWTGRTLTLSDVTMLYNGGLGFDPTA